MVKDYEEQRKMERLYYELYKWDCVNKNRPYVTEEEKVSQMKKLGSQWYEKNKNYKIHKSLANYYKKKDIKINCFNCNKLVCELTLNSHLKSVKCMNHFNQNIL